MEDLNLNLNEGTEEVVTPHEEQANETTESVNESVATSQESEKPVQSQEENAKFASIRREYEAKIATETQKAIDAEYSKIYGASHNIHSKADYDAAVKQAEEDARQEELRNQGIDPEVFNKYIEENPTVKQSKAIIEQQNQQRYLSDQVKALEEYSPGIDLSKLDPSIVKEFEMGKPLVDAYAKWENKNLKSELEAFKKGSATLETNNKNALSSPGSTTGNGSSIDQPLTAESINNMSEKDLSRRWAEVKKVMNMR